MGNRYPLCMLNVVYCHNFIRLIIIVLHYDDYDKINGEGRERGGERRAVSTILYFCWSAFVFIFIKSDESRQNNRTVKTAGIEYEL